MGPFKYVILLFMIWSKRKRPKFHEKDEVVLTVDEYWNIIPVNPETSRFGRPKDKISRPFLLLRMRKRRGRKNK